mmetsp:Transcript_7936/g.11774  ORF Transcript_7936/g.11774 Transcript_7936/m.11774 type:complete len:158 (+) Transcript_7936:260-733(+)
MRRNADKRASFFHKKYLTNPKKGMFHHRAPSRAFQRSVRGMLPYRTQRGLKAFRRLEVFDGVPAKYEETALFCVPSALSCLKLNPTTKKIKLGELCGKFGWTRKSIVEGLEEARKEASKAGFEHREKVRGLKKQAVESAAKSSEYQTIANQLAQFGF